MKYGYENSCNSHIIHSILFCYYKLIINMFLKGDKHDTRTGTRDIIQ